MQLRFPAATRRLPQSSLSNSESGQGMMHRGLQPTPHCRKRHAKPGIAVSISVRAVVFTLLVYSAMVPPVADARTEGSPPQRPAITGNIGHLLRCLLGGVEVCKPAYLGVFQARHSLLAGKLEFGEGNAVVSRQKSRVARKAIANNNKSTTPRQHNALDID